MSWAKRFNIQFPIGIVDNDRSVVDAVFSVTKKAGALRRSPNL
jgi:hypothetical protein